MNNKLIKHFYLFNKHRNRRYGLRVGDLVKVRRYTNAFRYSYGIVVDLSSGDNNSAIVYIYETNSVRKVTAEECKMVVERNAFKLSFDWK